MGKNIMMIVIFFTLSFLLVVQAENPPENFPPPEKGRMTFQEVFSNRSDLEGKVICAEITWATSIEQQTNGRYKFDCHYYPMGGVRFWKPIYFYGEEAKEFFEELAEKHDPKIPVEIYVYVNPNGELEVVGRRFRKGKTEYAW